MSNYHSFMTDVLLDAIEMDEFEEIKTVLSIPVDVKDRHIVAAFIQGHVQGTGTSFSPLVAYLFIYFFLASDAPCW